ncbi:hypothetical protein HK405_013890 [Cladochytrium tenue]|nr:hypothetical protein HK405_013890 [Cladochytrium tenue]
MPLHSSSSSTNSLSALLTNQKHNSPLPSPPDESSTSSSSYWFASKTTAASSPRLPSSMLTAGRRNGWTFATCLRRDVIGGSPLRNRVARALVVLLALISVSLLLSITAARVRVIGVSSKRGVKDQIKVPNLSAAATVGGAAVGQVEDTISQQVADAETKLPRACDHYALNGHLSAKSHLWQPYGLDYSSVASEAAAGTGAAQRGACPKRVTAQLPTDHLQILSLVTSGGAWLPAHLRNRLVFVVGDSNDRHANIHMCDRVGGTHTVVGLDGSEPDETSCRAHTHVCTVRDGSGAVFVWLTMFHLGVEMAAGRKNIFDASLYCEGGFPVDIRDRLQWVPSLLLGAAQKHFPEICARDGVPGCVLGGEQDGALRRRDAFVADSSSSDGGSELVLGDGAEGASPDGAPSGESGDGAVDGENADAVAVAEVVEVVEIVNVAPEIFAPPPDVKYFPIPDLVVAQSSIWDVREWRLYLSDVEAPLDDITATPGVLQTWLDKFVTLFLQPLRAILDTGVQRRTELVSVGAASISADGRVPLMVRTCPMPTTAHEAFPPHVVESQNEVVRELAAYASDEWWRYASSAAVPPPSQGQQQQPMLFRGVLDWAQLVRGVDSVQPDGFHQDDGGVLAFAQMVMSELELLDLERGRAAVL